MDKDMEHHSAARAECTGSRTRAMACHLKLHTNTRRLLQILLGLASHLCRVEIALLAEVLESMAALDPRNHLRLNSILVILGPLEVWPMFSAEALIQHRLSNRVLSKEVRRKI